MGLGASLNFENPLDVPLGLVGVYRHDIPVEIADVRPPSSQTMSVAAYYTGREYADLGVEFTHQRRNGADTFANNNVIKTRVRVYF